MEVAPDNAYVVRIQTLERREADLVSRLEQCIPPVDQHRADLERVRSELAAARDTHV